MRIDAHQHFWQYDPAEHTWMTDAMEALKRNFLPRDLEPLLRRAGVDGCIAVQARQSLEETRWLLELAEQNDFVLGVVGWVDLCSPDLPAQLKRFASHPRLVGVRHVVQDEPDEAFMQRADFQRGIGRLAEFGLTYDVLIYPRQLPAAIKLVEAFPNQPFVLDHIAKPLIAEGKLAPWDAQMRDLASHANMYCKLSGMVTEARWGQWTEEDFHPYLDVVCGAFGMDRLMVGSDWPVCTLSADYAQSLEIVMRYIQRFPVEQQDCILHKNCMRFYGIE